MVFNICNIQSLYITLALFCMGGVRRGCCLNLSFFLFEVNMLVLCH